MAARNALIVVMTGTAVVLTLALTALSPAQDAPPPEKPKAARSVHLWWDAPQGTDFYNEMTIEQSTRGSYFMACGFAHGYFGMQELAASRGIASDSGKTDKVVIFSVWDTYKGDDAKAVPADKRVELLHQDPDVRIGRFGGEGTGGQSFFTYNWKIGETCRFLVRAKPEGNKTAFSGYFFLNDKKQWKHLVTFRTITGGKPLSGYYSFVEDFRRDGKSVTEPRTAEFGNAWVKSLTGEWHSVPKVRFTGDRTPLNNINAGARENGKFFMTTGGETVQKTELRATIDRIVPKENPAPADLPK